MNSGCPYNTTRGTLLITISKIQGALCSTARHCHSNNKICLVHLSLSGRILFYNLTFKIIWAIICIISLHVYQLYIDNTQN